MEVSIIILCLILCAFFSGMEMAFISSNKIYLEVEKKQDDFISKILSKLTENPSDFIASMLVGNTIALVVYGFFMGEQLLIWMKNLGFCFSGFFTLFIQMLFSAILILATSRFLSNVLFPIYANFLIKFFAVPAYGFYLLFSFISTFCIIVSDFILGRFLKTKRNQLKLYFSKAELGIYITEQMSAVEDEDEIDSEIQIFQNALDFSGVKVSESMTIRADIVAVDLLDSVTKLKELFVETGYSKILVFENSIDTIVGYVHSFDLFKKPNNIKSILIPVEFVPENLFIKDVMNLLTKKRKSVAVVLDDYGETSGIITIEDIIEELFGEIEDEHDSSEECIEKELENGSYVFSTQLDVEYLNQTYKFNIPKSDSYETLGGFIMSFAKQIPLKGEVIIIGSYHFSIEKATNKKIELVVMTIKD